MRRDEVSTTVKEFIYYNKVREDRNESDNEDGPYDRDGWCVTTSESSP